MKKRILLFAVSLIFVLGFTACGKAKQSAEELIQQENEIIRIYGISPLMR